MSADSKEWERTRTQTKSSPKFIAMIDKIRRMNNNLIVKKLTMFEEGKPINRRSKASIYA